jgi:hypothetical protein
MKSITDTTLALNKIASRLAKAASLGVVMAACALGIAQSLPPVQLDANELAPCPIEEFTGTTIARHYALAWHDLAGALESGRTDGLGDEFVGFAKNRLVQRIGDQNKTGVHVRIADHGHHLKAVFYSMDGTAMQLLDHAQIEIQIFDGDKLLDTQNELHEYLVLMTPGADRWYVRDLEELPGKP